MVSSLTGRIFGIGGSEFIIRSKVGNKVSTNLICSNCRELLSSLEVKINSVALALQSITAILLQGRPGAN